MRVIQNRQLTKDIFALDLMGDFPYDQVQPGQFVNVLIGNGIEHPLRRPISIASCQKSREILTIIYRVVGEGTKWLSEQGQDAFINVMGPLGKGFSVEDNPSKVLVVGGGVGIPPLYQLSKELAQKGHDIHVFLGFRNSGDIFWVNEFGQLGNVTVCTEDGSVGIKGFVTAAIDPSQGWKTIYSCGPKVMLQALKNHFSSTGIKGYVSLEEHMACGVGACWGCTCRTSDQRSTKRVCKDGPVFSWEEVAL